jgi:hypothetical protein
MAMSGLGMFACVLAYLVPLVLLIVILIKVNGIANAQKRSEPRA